MEKNDILSDKRRLSIVNDLLSRKPTGDSGENPSYRDDEYWCYTAHKNKVKVCSLHPGWGYSDETLWDLGFKDDSYVRRYIATQFYETDNPHSGLSRGKLAGLSRKTNRIWERISPAIRRVRKTGNITGLYSCWLGSFIGTFYVYAGSSSEANAFLQTFLKPIFPDSFDREITTTFCGRSDASSLLENNQKCIEKMQADIDQKRNRAEKLFKDAKDLDSRFEYTKELILQNFNNAMHAK